MSDDASSGARIATFHAGLPKTGSSAIQRIFYDDHDKLLAAGIFYPRIRSFLKVDVSTLSKQVVGGLAGGHLLFAQSLGGNLRVEELERNGVFGDHSLVDQTLAAFDASGCRRLLLSSESFAMNLLARRVSLPAAFAAMERQAVLLFRRKDSWIVARYKQQVRDYRRSQASIRGFIESFSEGLLNYFAKCELMAKYIDSDQIFAVDYEANKKNVAGALCAAIGRPDLYSVPEVETDLHHANQVNVSLSNLGSLFLLYVNIAVPDDRERAVIRKALRGVDEKIVSELGEIDLLPADLATWAVNSHNAEVTQINARYGAALPQIGPAATGRTLRGGLSSAELEKIIDALSERLSRRLTGTLRSALPAAVIPE